MIGTLIDSLEGLSSTLRRGKAANVNDSTTKSQAVELAQDYFAKVRPILVSNFGESQQLLDHDATWQKLVRLAHGNNSRKSYFKTVTGLRKALAEFNIFTLTAGAVQASHVQLPTSFSQEETLLVETLEKLIPSAAASYHQGLTDLRAASRLSYRGTAAEFREALRETLDHLAPDVQVEKQDGFKYEKDLTKPTMKQKVRYVLSSRGRNKTQQNTAEKAISLIDELAGEVTRAIYNHASLATHVQQSKQEVEQIKRYADAVLFDLLEIRT